MEYWLSWACTLILLDFGKKRSTSFISSTSQLFLISSALFFIGVIRLRKTIGKIKEVLGNSDGAKQVHIAVKFVQEIVWKKFINLLLN